jgi:hypothetical protein
MHPRLVPSPVEAAEPATHVDPKKRDPQSLGIPAEFHRLLEIAARFPQLPQSLRVGSLLSNRVFPGTTTRCRGYPLETRKRQIFLWRARDQTAPGRGGHTPLEQFPGLGEALANRGRKPKPDCSRCLSKRPATMLLPFHPVSSHLMVL